MTVSYAMLGLIEESARHGYDLKQSYDRRFGDAKPIRFGQVYRTLAQLVRDGRAEVVGVEPGAGPERKRYAITPEGVADLDRWLAEPEDPQPQLQTVLFTKVVLALVSGRSAERFLDAQRARHMAAMRALTASRRESRVVRDSLLADYRLFHIEADLRWIDHAAGRLADLAREVRDRPQVGQG
ncbi:PadR family transcriptional regulator [Actinomadura sp. NBRC 104412]|uniref:PadR family transcriptional regulator n=1 Tax=Actinomadura sp. NBRC 104412 TaxID=3032203 RepID=UPI0024A022A8|nr:PadR family transcriptional regulator [Actinomadura sp. NBRC 104412]GLZ08110.1 PadR family transcriptional regulator [Actinomadura sp. NBRC 104412]